MNPRRLLVSAYGCEPGKGSEQGVGWNWVLQLAQTAEIIVITRSNNREAIQSALPDNVKERISFIYYDLPDKLQKFKNKERGLYLYYLLWQWGAYKVARKVLINRPVNYVMHLTFGSIWLPTFMHRLSVPFIWGPVGGGEAVPVNLISSLPFKGRFVQYSRYLLTATLRLNPLFLSPARRAKVILARTQDTASVIPKCFKSKTRVILETAATDSWFQTPLAQHQSNDTEPVEVIYTGRLVPFKNLKMALHAVANACSRGVSLRFTIVGDGPLEKPLRLLVSQLGITEVVTFAGRQTQEGVFSLLSKSDIYLFPSLREGGPWSLMEAMAVGLPTICVRTSGMAAIADSSCARMLEPSGTGDMIEGFTQALCDLAENPEVRQQMGANARFRLEREFKWEQKANFMASVFNDIEGGYT